MVSSVEKDDEVSPDKAEQQILQDYEQDIMSKVPFGGLGVATESHDDPFSTPFNSRKD